MVEETYTVWFAGAQERVDCLAGKSIVLTPLTNNFTSGSIRCPPYPEVCHVGDATVGIEDSTGVVGFATTALIGSALFLLTFLLN